MSVTWVQPQPANAVGYVFRSDLVSTKRAGAEPLLFHTPDGGELYMQGGEFVLDDGLFNAFYLSLFGGNENDSGLQGDDPVQWWGNLGETSESRKYRSRFQNLLRAIPAIPANLRRLEDALIQDTAWMVTEKLLTQVSALGTIPTLNRVQMEINAQVDTVVYSFNLSAPWGVRR